MDTDTLIAQAKHLIAIPSISGDNHALHQAVGYIQGLLQEDQQLTIERFESNGVPSLLAYKGQTRPERFAVLLNAHVDVVPGQPKQFIPMEKDGRLYGRGAQDMKTAALVMVQAFKEAVHTVPYALGLQIVADEETNGRDCIRLQVREGVRADFAIYGEHNFSRNIVYNATRGICWIEVTFGGQTAHGGYPWEGENALLKATAFTQHLLEKYPIPDKATWGTTANIARIKTTNDTYNRVPDHARVEIDFRFTHEDQNFVSEESVTKMVQSLHPEAKITDFQTFEPAVYVDPSNPYLQKLLAAVSFVQKQPADIESRYGSGDSRHMAAVGCHGVEFGLMGKGPHSDEEFVEIDNIAEYYEALRLFLESV